MLRRYERRGLSSVDLYRSIRIREGVFYAAISEERAKGGCEWNQSIKESELEDFVVDLVLEVFKDRLS